MPPEWMGPYRLEDRLGRGGMGEVFRAYDRRLERWVALKRIRPAVLAAPGARERFRREARAAASLSHPAIVQVYDFVETATGDAIVMELVTGETLRQRLARGPLTVTRAVDLGRQIAAGLEAAHRCGILHRDLKAENVLLTADGGVKILDFGLVQRLSKEPSESSAKGARRLAGTFHAMSPEQVRGQPLDGRSDLFALGVLLYEALTGRNPFSHRDGEEHPEPGSHLAANAGRRGSCRGAGTTLRTDRPSA